MMLRYYGKVSKGMQWKITWVRRPTVGQQILLDIFSLIIN